MTPRQRGLSRGFVLITILWILIGIGVLAFAASFVSRTAAASARNRSALAEAQWKAYGCIERARAAVHSVITAVSPDAVIAVWDSLDRVVYHSPFLAGTTCVLAIHASGSGLNINEAPAEQLQRFFTALDIAPARIDSLIDALLDWRDPDDFARPLGAEREWYQLGKRLPPRNGPFANPREILYVRGFEQFGDTVALLSTEDSRIPISHVPLTVLASLPGITPEAVASAAALRRRNERVNELLALGIPLPKSAKDTLMAHYAELSRYMTVEPERWILVVTGRAGNPVVEVTTEVQLARAGTRVAILGRK